MTAGAGKDYPPMKLLVALVTLFALVGLLQADDRANTAGRTGVRADTSFALDLSAEHLAQQIEDHLYDELSRCGVAKIEGNRYTIQARQIEKRRLFEVVLIGRDAGSNLEIVINAKEGELHVSRANGVVLVLLKDGDFANTDGSRGTFTIKAFEFGTPTPPKKRSDNPAR